MSTPRLRALHLSKTFGATKVLDDVELVVQPGEIHALVGQNGSGKSTIVKVLTGYHVPDPGVEIEIDGAPLALPIRFQSLAGLGVSVVHQDLGLLDHLSVAENIGVGGFTKSKVFRRINWRKQREIAQRVLDRLQVHVDPDTPVGALDAATRAEIGIARALRDQVPGSGLVILDEATRALPREELKRFHSMLKRVVAEGTSVLMVSHNLDEVLSLSDRVTILRDGRVAGGAMPTAELSEQEIARLMLGKSVERVVRTSTVTEATPIIAEVAGLTGGPLRDISITVREGEVVGLTGLPGSGFELIPGMLAGSRPAQGGTMTIDGRTLDLTKGDVETAMEAGIALVPEGRIREGLALEMSIQDNIAIPSVKQRGKPWRVGRNWQRAEANAAIERLGIKTNSPTMLVKELSGGNQQKVLFGKWLSVQPRLFVLHEPTQAVDVGARQDLLRVIRETAATGVGVLLATIEPSDLTEVCDRILVYRTGEPLIELTTEDPDVVLEAVYSGAVAAAGGSHVE